MLLAIFLRIVVFPALGGATIIPLCPFPIGATKSINLIVISLNELSNLNLLSGYIGVSESKSFLLRADSGLSSLTCLTYKSALNFSPCLGGLVIPVILSPVCIWNLLI